MNLLPPPLSVSLSLSHTPPPPPHTPQEDLSERHAHEQALLESTLKAESEAQLAELRAKMERENRRKTEALQNQHKQELNVSSHIPCFV